MVDLNITEEMAWQWCEKNNLLSPIYKTAIRGGCWFCPKQRIGELRNLRKAHPDYWNIMLKWDKDSKIPFKINATVADLEKRFDLEDRQLCMF